MALQPGNPVVGGVVLRTPAIESPNFVAGTSGWIVRIDGTAEFDALIIRGLIATTGIIIAQNVYADAGAYGGTPGTKEDWHAMTLLNGWANRGTGYAKAAYRGVTSPPNGIEIVGEITHTSITGTSTIATLTGGYVPATGQLVTGAIDSEAGGTSPQLYIDKTGNLIVFGLSATTLIQFHGLISLDAPSA